MREVVVSMRDNKSRFILGKRTFYVVSQIGTNEYTINQHFDLAQFENCYNKGITVIVKP